MDPDPSVASDLAPASILTSAPQQRSKIANNANSTIENDTEASVPARGSDPGLASEDTPLLAEQSDPPDGQANGDGNDPDSGKLSGDTTWQQEAKILSRFALPQIPTFLLQYSLPLATVISIGHLGTIELGAVSLGAMSANITGMAVFSGLATSLDTLCAQAYGSGKKTLVGLHVQRMVLFMWTITIPIGVLWLFASPILNAIIPEPEVADLAGQYLTVCWFGLPGYAAFTSGKRYYQAQGNFSAGFYVIIVVASLNAFLNWLFVWQLGWGFIGAPIAVSVTCHTSWMGLVAYGYFIGGRECWPGLTWQAFQNWGPMIRLALPGLVMVEAEVLSFEILTLASSWFGPVALAANTVLFSTINVAFQVALPLGIATSTRVAHLIGARNPTAAKVSARIGLMLAAAIGLFNVIVLSALKGHVPRLFSDDPAVWDRAAEVLPLCAIFLLFDATATCCNGILRGLGRQSIGSYIQLFCFYVIGMPISFVTAFKLEWTLHGLWGGLMIALLSVTIIEAVFIRKTNWQRSVDDAIRRNELG